MQNTNCYHGDAQVCTGAITMETHVYRDGNHGNTGKYRHCNCSDTPVCTYTVTMETHRSVQGLLPWRHTCVQAVTMVTHTGLYRGSNHSDTQGL